MLVVSVLGYSGPMLLISSNTDIGALPRESPNAGSVGSNSTLSLSRYISCIRAVPPCPPPPTAGAAQRRPGLRLRHRLGLSTRVLRGAQ